MAINNRRPEGTRPFGVRRIPASGVVTALKTDSQSTFQFDTSGGAGTLNLPRTNDWASGAKVGIVNTDGTNTITVTPSAGQTINGGANLTIPAAVTSVTLMAPALGVLDWSIADI